MALQPVASNMHPTRLVRYMDALRGDLQSKAKSIREETDPEQALTHLGELADQVDNLASVVQSLTGHIARMR